MSDTEALRWLDRLLAAGDNEREESLRALGETDPALKARLVRMLASAMAPEHSRVLAAPVLDGLVRMTDATRSLSGGSVLSGYRLIRELGRGGMSVVWLAERADGVLKRQVALKMPMFMLQGAADQERFARERDALAALSHRNVAQLFDAGVLESGQPFIVLEYVDGQPLTTCCDSRRLGLHARIRLFLQVLGAVEHAHKHLIVHRDLKPSNILVDNEGQVKLLDFGIAKLLGEPEGANALTQREGGAMTPLYAGPEQIRGGAISTLTDVFSLGVVLCELLSGSLPYRGARGRATLVEVLEALARGELPRASQLVSGDSAAPRGFSSAAKLRDALAGDLDTLIGKALRVSPEDRYASAAHLADDLRRWLDHQPIAARSPSFWYSTKLALRRHRLAAGVAGVGVFMVAGASVVAWRQFLESRAHAERTAAVRDFMFDLVNDAEPLEGQKGDVTGKQMVDGAVARARREFAERPQLQGELLAELGRMYLRLDSPRSAVPVLEEAVRILESHAPGDDPALNKSRGFLAGALLRTGEGPARVAALAEAARASCRDDSTECHKALAYAANLLSQVAARSGDSTRALAESRRFVADTERAFGRKHAETAVALMSLAIIARNAGEFSEADAAITRSLETAEGLRMRAVDRAQIGRTRALVDLDLGRYEQARQRLEELIRVTGSASERALQWRILANLHAETGDGAAALAAAESALGLLPENSAAESRLFTRQARARGLSLVGQESAAIAEFDAVIDALQAGGRARTSTEVLRARRYRAEAMLHAGRAADALPELRALREAHEGAGTSVVEVGLLLDLLADAEARLGQANEAHTIRQAARQHLSSQLPPGHPYLNRE